MEINATTYETIFLLYIDNELSPKERLQVEAWIAENPSYALLMEELKGTLMLPESIRFPNKSSLKKEAIESIKENVEVAEIENLDAIWTATYSNYLMQEMQAMPGLSTEFKKGLKRETASKGIVLSPFSFNQNKFAYAAVAAMLMLFIGYQQLTKTTETYTLAAVENSPQKQEKAVTASNTKEVPNIKQAALPINNTVQIKRTTEVVAVKEAVADNSLIASTVSSNNLQAIVAYETEASTTTTATIEMNEIAENPAFKTEINTLANMDEKSSTSYEIIDTEDLDRTIYIGNLEIDGNRLRGLKRKVTSLFKNNKSDKNK
jgi:hypothetical protein